MRTDERQLQVKAITGVKGGPRLLVTGGVHGDEYEPMIAVRRLMREVDAKSLAGTLTLIPCVNEPAFARGARTAEDGLDLARVCPGRENGSITEQTADALSRWIRQSEYFIDLHTGGTLFRATPLAGYFLHADAAVLEKQRRMAQAFNLPLVWGTSANEQGRSLSVARDAGVPAIYCEYGGGGVSRQGIRDYVEGCLNVMRELAMIQRPISPSRVRHTIEDPRQGGGHLQIQYPSPADGCFEPAIEPGQVVEKGQELGTVSNVLGDEIHAVKAADSGVIVIVRAVAMVEQGDTLLAIASQPGEARHG